MYKVKILHYVYIFNSIFRNISNSRDSLHETESERRQAYFTFNFTSIGILVYGVHLNMVYTSGCN